MARPRFKKRFEDDTPINERIRAKEVRVIDSEGKQLGILNIREAIALAEDKGLDLVEVSPNANPPVCRIMDYGKFKYEKNKKAKEAKKKQTIIQIKEIKLRPRTDEHDFNFKMKHMLKFLKEGAKVKVNIFLRGREVENTENAFELVERIKEVISDIATLENNPRREGRIIHLMISPNKPKK